MPHLAETAAKDSNKNRILKPEEMTAEQHAILKQKQEELEALWRSKGVA